MVFYKLLTHYYQRQTGAILFMLVKIYFFICTDHGLYLQ